jgi:hypothetical protein
MASFTERTLKKNKKENPIGVAKVGIEKYVFPLFKIKKNQLRRQIHMGEIVAISHSGSFFSFDISINNMQIFMTIN